MAIGWGGFCRILAYSPDCDWRCVCHLTLYLHISIYLLETITHTTSGQPLCNRPQEILWQINIFTLKWAPTLTSTQSLRHRSLHERWVGLLRFVGEIKPEEVLIWNWWLGIIWFLICICNATARQHRHWLTITSTTFHLVKNPSGLLRSRGRLY